MKTFVTILLFLCIFTTISFAEPSTLEKANQLAEQTNAALDKIIDSTASGFGHQIGLAVSESLNAMTSEIGNLSQTPAGKTALIIIIWKFIAKDVIKMIFTFVFLIFGWFLIFPQLRKSLMPYKIKIINNEGKEIEQLLLPAKTSLGDYRPAPIAVWTIALFICNLTALIAILAP